LEKKDEMNTAPIRAGAVGNALGTKWAPKAAKFIPVIRPPPTIAKS
jgi:hypothetical protein